MVKSKFKSVTCCNCGWVAMEVSRKFAENEVKRFNDFFNTLSKKEQNDYYGGKGATITFYECCFLCGGSYKNFRDFQPGDCPDGCTLNPIIRKID